MNKKTLFSVLAALGLGLTALPQTASAHQHHAPALDRYANEHRSVIRRHGRWLPPTPHERRHVKRARLLHKACRHVRNRHHGYRRPHDRRATLHGRIDAWM